MNTLFTLHIHGFTLTVFLQHLFFDSCATIGAYKARTICKHAWHRIAVTILITLIATVALVTLVG